MRKGAAAIWLTRAVLVASIAATPAGCARTGAQSAGAGPTTNTSAADEREGPPSWVWVAIGAVTILALVAATADVEGLEADYNPYD